MKKVLIIGNEVTQSVVSNAKTIQEIIEEQNTIKITRNVEYFERPIDVSHKSGQEFRRERIKKKPMKQFTRKGVKYLIKDSEVYRLPFTNGKRTLPLKKCLKNDKGYSLSGETVSFSWVEKNAVECSIDLTNINI